MRKLPVEPFGYFDFRQFMTDLVEQWKKDHYRWTFATFAKDMGYAAPNYLKLIIVGKRNMTDDTAVKVVRYFNFNKQEANYFYALIDFNQAKNDIRREEAFQRMIQNQKFSEETQVASDVHQFYSTWYNPVIREMVTLKEFSENPSWVGKRLLPKISDVEVSRALSFLQDSGHLTRDTKGSLVQSDPVSSTGQEVASLAVANYHREMLARARESLDTIPPESRNLSSLTMALSKDTYETMVREIYAFQDRMIKLALNEENSDDVYQLNFQLFPVTEDDKRGQK